MGRTRPEETNNPVKTGKVQCPGLDDGKAGGFLPAVPAVAVGALGRNDAIEVE